MRQVPAFSDRPQLSPGQGGSVPVATVVASTDDMETDLVFRPLTEVLNMDRRVIRVSVSESPADPAIGPAGGGGSGGAADDPSAQRFRTFGPLRIERPGVGRAR